MHKTLSSSSSRRVRRIETHRHGASEHQPEPWKRARNRNVPDSRGRDRLTPTVIQGQWQHRRVDGLQLLWRFVSASRLTITPQHTTDRKVERFNRTLADEWVYARVSTSNSQRARALDRFLHTYNHHRGHTAVGGEPPITRTNLAGQHTQRFFAYRFFALPPSNSSRQPFAETSTSYFLAADLIRRQARSRSASVDTPPEELERRAELFERVEQEAI